MGTSVSKVRTIETAKVVRTLTKDVYCILRMYAVQDFVRDNTPIEDSIDSPFNELSLIRHFGKSYQFKISAKANLPVEIIVATCLEYASWVSQGRKTINIPSLLYWVDEDLPNSVASTTSDGKPLVILSAANLDILRIRTLEFVALNNIKKTAKEL